MEDNRTAKETLNPGSNLWGTVKIKQYDVDLKVFLH